jgi:hypothetical protein
MSPEGNDQLESNSAAKRKHAASPETQLNSNIIVKKFEQ